MTIEQLREHIKKREKEVETNTEDLESRIKKYNRWVVVCLITGLAVAAIGIFNIQFETPPEGKAGTGLTLNEFGDFLAGTVASIFSLAGIIYIYIAFLGQKEQLLNQQLEILYNRLEVAESREELKGQKEQLAIQNKIQQKQKFESGFYDMIGLYHDVMNSFSKTETGKNFFVNIKKTLQEHYHSFPQVEYIYYKPTGSAFYNNYYESNKDDLAHYLRVLYRIFKFIDEADLTEKEKWFYTKTVRAQLSEGELFVLYYNAFSDNGVNFKELIVKYNLTKHLPIVDRLEVEKFYRRGFEPNQTPVKGTFSTHFPNYFLDETVIRMKHLLNALMVVLKNVQGHGLGSEREVAYDDLSGFYKVRSSVKDGIYSIELVYEVHIEKREGFFFKYLELDKELYESKLQEMLGELLHIRFVYDTFNKHQTFGSVDISTSHEIRNKGTEDSPKVEKLFKATIQHKDKKELKLNGDKY